jgi:poly(A) polymerase
MDVELENCIARLNGRGLRWCWVGAAARAHLGFRAVRSRAELLVETEAATLDDLFPDAWTRSDGSRLGADCVVRSAPDGLEAALVGRGVRVDAVGVLPDGTVLDPLDGRRALEALDLGFRVSGLETQDGALGLRVLAVASELATAPSAAFLGSVTENAGAVLKAPAPLVFDLLDRLLLGRRPAEALDALERTRLLGFTLPEVAALVGLHRTSRFPHKDVWEHTRIVVKQAIPRPEIRWGALLHDIGKPWTRTFEPPRTVHFLQHDDLGAAMLPGVALRLEFPTDLAARVRRLVQLHLRANLYAPAWTDAAIRRFTGEIGEDFDDLLHLSRADVTSKRAGRRREAIANLHHLRTRVESLVVADEARAPCVPKGLGLEIMRQLGVSPGPEVGLLRRACEDAVRRGELPNDAEVGVYIDYLRHRAA